MIVGITGHQDLGSPAARSWLSRSLSDVLDQHPVTAGISSLAAGADQLFASAVLARGLPLIAVLPSNSYETAFQSDDARETYRALLSRAREVVTLDYPAPSEEAFWAAGKEVVRRSELIIAIWNGKPAAGLGGTADVVDFATRSGVPVVHINPVTLTVGTLS